jgi:transcriptional regulator with XRE-family HTH domain
MTRRELARIAWVRSMIQSGAALAIRKAARVSMPEMAEAIGCSVSTLWRWEAGDRQPRGKLALRYAGVLESLQETIAAAEPASEAPKVAP